MNIKLLLYLNILRHHFADKKLPQNLGISYYEII